MSELVPVRVEPGTIGAERAELVQETVEESVEAGGAVLVGRVVAPEAERARMGDVRVWWTYEAGVARSGSLVTRAPVTPKADGNFRLANLPVDVPLILWANAPFAHDWGRALEAFTEGEQRTLELVLEGPVAIAGRVIDTAGIALAGVTVRVEEAEPRPAEDRGGVAGRHLSTVSDERGEFRLGQLSRGLWSIGTHKNLADGSEQILDTRAGDVLGVELVQEAEKCLVVRLRWPDGTPASGIQYKHESGTRVRLGNDGELVFCGLPSGEHELLFAANRDGVHGIAIARVRLPGTDELELVLREPQPASLRGTVRDPHGRAVPGARVVAHVAKLGSRETPAGGGKFELDGLPEGRWNVKVLADGYWTPPRSLIVDALTLPQDFVLAPGASIRGRVVDTEGRPVEGARLSGGTSLVEDALTDAEGRFSCTVAPGTLELLASAKGYSASLPLELTLGEGEQLADVVLVLRPTCTLFARVRDTSGVPIHGATVGLMEQLTNKVSLRGRFSDSETDARGVATLEGIPAGHFTLCAEAPGFHRTEQKSYLEPGPPLTLDVVLTRSEPGGR